MKQSFFSSANGRAIFTIGIIVLAAGIFVFDVLTPIEVSVSVLYVFVVLVASLVYSRTGIVMVGLACEVLTLLSHVLSPGDAWGYWPLLDRIICVIGIAMSTLLVVRNRVAAETLSRSEAYLAEAQRLSQTGSIGWHDPHREEFWSRETWRIYGYEETIKPTLTAMIARTHPDDRTQVQQKIEQASRDGAGFELEHRLLMPDGTIRFVQLVTRPTRERAGDMRFVGAVMDVTAARRASDDLQRIQSDLARITRVTTMGQLAASIAHEINQPLTGVVTNGYTLLHWLNERTLNLDKARVTAERLLRDGERASGVIQRIQGFLQKAPPQATDVDLNHLIDEVLELLQTELRLREIIVQAELATDLPPVLGDAVQLQQVLLNLVINGTDAMSGLTDRSKSLVIGSRATPDGDGLVFVRDHGTGFDRETADKIFDPFFTTKAKGMGMGLAICRSIVEAHGGRLWAMPAEPHGALFQFTLPNRATADDR